MFRSFLLNWLSSQYGREVQSQIYEAAAEALRGAAGEGEDPSSLRADVGLVFARGAEYGSLLDRLEDVETTKGNGLKFTRGRYQKTRLAIVEAGRPDAVREGILALLQVFRPRRVVAAGFAAALSPEIKRGALYIPSRLVSPDGEEIDAALGAPAPPGRETPQDPVRFETAPIVTVESLPAGPNERAELARKTGAALADTLTWQAVSVCREESAPCLVVKAVAAEYGDSPPTDLRRAAEIGRGSAARKFGALFGAITNRPSSLLDLYKVKERELETAETLADALVRIVAASAETSAPEIPDSAAPKTPNASQS